MQLKPLAESITPLVQRQAEVPEEEEEEGAIQTKSAGSAVPEVTSGLDARIHSMRGGGQPLSKSEREFFEPRFGADFSHVRLHTDVRAAETARSLNARAFTLGSDIAFANGQYSPTGNGGRHLLAHELAHTVQQRQAYLGDQSAVQRSPESAISKCSSKTHSSAVVSNHTVEPSVIEKPGDKVRIRVTFACKIRGDGIAKMRQEVGGKEFLRANIPKLSKSFERTWDGKMSVGENEPLLVDDGNYTHKLEKILYAYKYDPKTEGTKNLYATGSNLVSPLIEVKARKFGGAGAKHVHLNSKNVEDLATIIQGEIGIGNPVEKEAIAWAVRNQMVRLNTVDVKDARVLFKDQIDTATKESLEIAKKILGKSMTEDTTQGSIKWFSPRSMPKEGESCVGKGCDGGLMTISDDEGKSWKVFTPAFHKIRHYVPLDGVREWYMRFYRL